MNPAGGNARLKLILANPLSRWNNGRLLGVKTRKFRAGTYFYEGRTASVFVNYFSGLIFHIAVIISEDIGSDIAHVLSVHPELACIFTKKIPEIIERE